METIIEFVKNGILNVFLYSMNRSLTVIVFILAVLLVRLLFRRMPKKYLCVLWILVFARLVLPGTMQSSFSLNPIPEMNIYYESEESGIVVNTGMETLDENANHAIDLYHENAWKNEFSQETSGLVPENGESQVTLSQEAEKKTNPVDRLLFVPAFVWLGGIVLILCYSAVRFGGMKRRIATATKVSNYEIPEVSDEEFQKRLSLKTFHIYESDQIESPFLFGFFRPRIYLPLALEDRNFVILHEQMHVLRKDHIFKPVLFFIACVYWFHPLVWIAFYFFARDVEMAVDEAVCRAMSQDGDVRKDYAKALLKLSMKQSGLYLPLAFGESNTKERIKHILAWSRGGKWLTGVAVLLVIIVTICFGFARTDKRDTVQESQDSNIQIDVINPSYFCEWGGEKLIFSESQLKDLADHRILYVGEAPATKAIFDRLLTTGELSVGRSGMSMKTSSEPYEVRYEYTLSRTYEEDLKQTDREGFYEKLFYANSMLAFSSIDNLGVCEFVVNYADCVVTYRCEKEAWTVDYLDDEYVSFYAYSESSKSMELLVQRINAVMMREEFSSLCEVTIEGIDGNTLNSWQSAYIEIICNMTDYLVDPHEIRTAEAENLQVYAGIYDFDREGIPELIFGDGVSIGIFTYRSGNVVKLTDLYFPEGRYAINGVHFKDGRLCLESNGSDGSGYINFGYIDGEYVKGSYDEYCPEETNINGKAATLEEFNQIYDINDIDYSVDSMDRVSLIRMKMDGADWVMALGENGEIIVGASFPIGMLSWHSAEDSINVGNGEDFETAVVEETITVMVYDISRSARVIDRYDVMMGIWELDEIALHEDCTFHFDGEDSDREFDDFASLINYYGSVGTECEITIQNGLAMRIEALEFDFVKELYSEKINYPEVTFYEDLTHDGVEERIVVEPYFALHMPRTGLEKTVQVYSGATDALIWYGHADSVHGGWSGYYIYTDTEGAYGEAGNVYLLQWEPEMWQGEAVYEYYVFSLTETGQVQDIVNERIEFSINVWNDDENAVEELTEYDEGLNELLRNSYVLIDTNDQQGLYSPDGSKLVHEHDFSGDIGALENLEMYN